MYTRPQNLREITYAWVLENGSPFCARETPAFGNEF